MNFGTRITAADRIANAKQELEDAELKIESVRRDLQYIEDEAKKAWGMVGDGANDPVRERLADIQTAAGDALRNLGYS